MEFDYVTGTATITVKELHDMLTNGNFSVRHEEGEDVPWRITVKGEDSPAIQCLVARVNTLLETIRELDCEFHDEFEDKYC